MSKDLFELVEKFNHEVVGVPKRKFKNLEGSEARWLANVLMEEAYEYEVATANRDAVAQVDALIDSIYYAMGGLTRLGLTPEQSLRCFKCVHARNMKKVGGNKGRGSDLDAVKPESWEGPEAEISKIVEQS